MDAETSIAASMVGGVDQNGVHKDNPCRGKESVANEQADEIQEAVQVISPDVCSGVHDGSNNGDLTTPSTQKVTEHTHIHEESTCLHASEKQEGGAEQKHQEKNFNRQNSQGKAKGGKPLSSKISGGVGVKKTDSGKELKAGSNGTLSASVRPKQPILKFKSFNDGQIAASNVKKMMKPVSSTSNARKPKTMTSDSPIATKDAAPSDAPREKTRVKPPRKGPQHKTEGNSDSILSPRSEDARSHRVGKLPSYGFNFRCNERAEKRREFFSKLDEKFQAKEVEISNQEAKSKETQAAEIKMLRKRLNFKATPMPSFYQEPPPPKVELKKIPTTRPRSPKLGRKKSSSTLEGKDNDSGSHNNSELGRLSLGAKVPKSKPLKGTEPAHLQKPQRKSLPRLPSEKTLPSKASSKPAKDIAKAIPPATQIEEETAHDPEPYQAPFVSEIESVNVAEGPISTEQQPVTVEN